MIGEKIISKRHSLPINLLPKKLQYILNTVIEHKQLQKDYLFSAVLSCVGAVYGNTAKLTGIKSYVNYPNLMTVLIGSPSDGKTPALEFASEPLKYIDKEIMKQVYFSEMEQAELVGKKATYKSFLVSNTTAEKITIKMSSHSRCTFGIFDELKTFLGGLDRSDFSSNYNKLTQYWSNQVESAIERATAETLFLDKDAFFGFAGGIPTNDYKKLLRDKPQIIDSGLAVRLFFSKPNSANKLSNPFEEPKNDLASYNKAHSDYLHAFLKVIEDKEYLDLRILANGSPVTNKLKTHGEALLRHKIMLIRTYGDDSIGAFIGKFDAIFHKILLISELMFKMFGSEQDRYIYTVGELSLNAVLLAIEIMNYHITIGEEIYLETVLKIENTKDRFGGSEKLKILFEKLSDKPMSLKEFNAVALTYFSKGYVAKLKDNQKLFVFNRSNNMIYKLQDDV